MAFCALLQRTGKTKLFHAAWESFAARDWGISLLAKRCLRGVRTNFEFATTFTVNDAHEQRSSCDN
jgi:hypothetical protein